MDSQAEKERQRARWVHLSEGENYFFSVVLLLEGFVILVSNILAMKIFLKRKFLINKSCYLLVNLTLADLLVGLSSIVVWFVTKTVRLKSSNDLKIPLFSFWFPIASLSSLAIISIERATAVFMPLRHRVADNGYYTTGISVSWVFFAVSLILNFKIEDKRARDGFVFGTIVLLLLIITVSYSSIYIKIRFFPAFLQSRMRQYQCKLSKTLFLTTVVSILAWLPFACVQSYMQVYGKRGIPDVFFMITLVAQLSNSFLNMVVYSFRMAEFRKELKQILCFKCCIRQQVHPSQRVEAFCLHTRVSQRKRQKMFK